MAFFRKWKGDYRHKQLKSSDHILDEDSLSINLNIQSKSDPVLNLDLSKLNNLEGNDSIMSTKHIVKYMGCTNIEATRSEKLVANAIKIVKSNRTKKQAQRRVNINVMPTKVEVIDIDTFEIILHLSIYDISYCTAQQENFALVGLEKCSNLDQEKPSCYVFQCPKRKIAQEITLAVARSFGYAYQQWRQKIVEKNHNQALALLKETIEDDNSPVSNSDTNNSEFNPQCRDWVIFDENKDLL